jgi:hypothetical protein
MNLLRQLVLTLFLTSVMFGQHESEKIQKMVDLFVSAYNSKSYSLIEEQFNRDVQAKVIPEELKKWYDGLHEVSGKIKSVGKPAFIEQAVVVYQIEFERGTMELMVALDEQGKIRGLDIHVRKVNALRNRLSQAR